MPDDDAARRPGRRRQAWAAAAAYAALTLVLTWPLGRGLARDLPNDVADPLLNCWIVGWGAAHVLRFAHGDWSAFAGFWNANIFHPAPLALTYSEHLFAQALQAAPVYAATGDLVLCYNLLFLSTFVLSGSGMFLLARDITREPLAAFAAGLLFAFAPYRFEHAAHLQLLSLQWLPLALLGLRRFVRSARLRPLALATLALVAHDLSCGYYLLFFAPFVAGWALFEMASAGRLGSMRRWLGLAACAAVTLAATLPFLLPYAEARRLEATQRTPRTVVAFSADLAAWATATPLSRVWAPLLPGFDQPEGHLFPGLLPLLLAAVAIVGGTVAWLRPAPRAHGRLHSALVAAVSVVAGAVAARHLPWPADSQPVFHGPGFSYTPVTLALFVCSTTALALALSAPVRALARRAVLSYTGFCTAAVLLAAWLSLGPEPRLWGLDTGLPGAYSWLYAHVPGFDGLRAPARYAAVVVVFLSLLAAIGVARLRRFRYGDEIAWGVLAIAVVESLCLPLPMNVAWTSPGLHLPPAVGHVPEPAVYAAVRALPADAVLLELPLGDTVWDTRAMYYSTRHWRALVNGYSGYFPRTFLDARAALGNALRDPDAAWSAVRATGATHLLVHRAAWIRGPVGERLAHDFEARGARRLGDWDDDVLLAVMAAD